MLEKMGGQLPQWDEGICWMLAWIKWYEWILLVQNKPQRKIPNFQHFQYKYPEDRLGLNFTEQSWAVRKPHEARTPISGQAGFLKGHRKEKAHSTSLIHLQIWDYGSVVEPYSSNTEIRTNYIPGLEV